MLYRFDACSLDTDRRELRRGTDLVRLEPQVFDLLVLLIRNRDRVVSKDDLITAIWGGRIVSESALTTRINAVRSAIGDSGDERRLVKTFQRSCDPHFCVDPTRHPLPRTPCQLGAMCRTTHWRASAPTPASSTYRTILISR